jgi:hypothetical protein
MCDIGVLNDSHDGVMSEMARSAHLGRAHSSGRHAKSRAADNQTHATFGRRPLTSADSAMTEAEEPFLARNPKPRRKLGRWPIGEGRS